MQETRLKTLVKIYFDSQKFRVLAGNRLSHVQNIDVNEPSTGILEYMETKGIASEDDLTIDDLKAIARSERAKRKKEKDYASKDGFENVSKRMLMGYSSIENDIMKEMESELNRYPISQWLIAHRGIGTIFTAGLIAYIGDIGRFGTVSKLWQYAGMGVMEICHDCGKRVRRTASVTHDFCCAAYFVVIRAQYNRIDAVALGRPANYHAFCTGFDVLSSSVYIGEEPGRFDYDIDVHIAPRQECRVALGEHTYASAINHKIVVVECHVVAIRAVVAVML